MSDESVCGWCGKAFAALKLGRPKKYCHVNCKASASRHRTGEAGRERRRQANAAYYSLNRERLKAYQRKYNADHPDRKRESDAATYRKNRASRLKYQKSWTQKMKAESPDRYSKFLRDQSERARRRAANAAIAAILLPTHNLPEASQ